MMYNKNSSEFKKETKIYQSECKKLVKERESTTVKKWQMSVEWLG